MSEQLSTAIRELIEDAAEPVTPVDAMQRGRRHRRRRHRAVLLAGVATVIGVVAITALAWPREEQSLHTIGRDGRFPELRGFVAPADAAHPPLVSNPLRSTVVRFSIGPKAVSPASPPTSAVVYETTYDEDGNWVTRSLDASPSSLQEYRDGVYTLSQDGRVLSRVTIDPVNRPYQPTFTLTRYGAAFVANEEWLANRGAKTASERVRGVRCNAGPPCVEVVYRRQAAGAAAEDATLVYDANSKLVWYYRLRVNGHVTHEFTMESVRPALSLHIDLPARNLPTGAVMTGELVIENDTGSARSLNDPNGCQTGWGIVLGNDRIPPAVPFSEVCIHKPLAVALGETRLPFTIHATYPYCNETGLHAPGALSIPRCAPGGSAPPLPPGLYYATFVDNGTHLPLPPPVAIRVSTAGQSTDPKGGSGPGS